jgi:hypothetical protein
LDSTHDLRIGGGQPAVTDNHTWTGQPAAAPPPPPSPAPAPAAPAEPVATHNIVLANGGQITSYEQAQAQLAARGVSWQRLETWGDQGDWKFSCSIPNPQNRFISRTYEAQAHDYLSAMRAVLDQINKDR